MKINILSKSTFIRGLQCHKSLYLYKNRYFLRDKTPPEQQAKFKRGTDVGKLARELFPGGIDVSPPTPFQYAKAIEQTKKLISRNEPVIYEASFSFNGVLVALDILEHRDGKWYGYEVKSSLSISETFLNDAALQYHVIQGCGIELADIFIIHMNKDYVLHGELDLQQLFVTQSVLKEVSLRQAMVRQEIESQLKVVVLSKSPVIDIGQHCNKPYPCDFKGHCWKHISNDSIFDLQWLSEEQKFELYSKNILKPDHIPEDFLTDPNQNLKLKAHKTLQPIVDHEFIRGFVKRIIYPVCFLKVWYHRPAVPLIEGTGPYERLPFYAGLGLKGNPESETVYSHIFFESDTDPRAIFQEKIRQIVNSGSLNIGFNNPDGVWIREMAAKQVTNADHESYYDLFDLFREGKLYFPSTFGNDDLLALSGKLLNNMVDVPDIFHDEFEATLEYPEKAADSEDYKIFIEKMEKSSIHHLRALENLFHFIMSLGQG